MSDTAALVPVPYYPPARDRTGNAGTLLTQDHRARNFSPVVKQVQAEVLDEKGALSYDQYGIHVDQPLLGVIVDIWV